MVDNEKDTQPSKESTVASSAEKTISSAPAPTMDTTSEQVPAARRKSDVTEVTNDSVANSNASPLFNLVTAASRLLDNHSSAAEESKNEKLEREGDDHAAKITDDSMTSKEGSGDSQVDRTKEKKVVIKADSPKKDTKDSSVIKGTKEDLIRTPNQKPTFAEQLYDILENEEHHDVLQWMPDGTAFTVVNHKKFTLYKMAKLFNIRNMSSFVRKLGRWGFSRVHEKQSNNSDIFRHPDFRRGERATVKRKVRCLGRLIAAGNAQQRASGGGQNDAFMRGPGGASRNLRREADFVVPMTSQGPLVEGTLPFHDAPALNESIAGGGSMLMEPTLDRVTDASAASAEALYLSHRQFQQAKMEQLVRDQHDLNEREIQNLLRQRELEFAAQKRRIILEQQQLQEAALRSAAMTSQDNKAYSSLASMRRTLPDIQGLPGSPGGLVRPPVSSAMEIGPNGALQDFPMASRVGTGAEGPVDEHQLQQMMALQQERRAALMDQSQPGLDDSISRSMGGIPAALSRHTLTGGSTVENRMMSSPSAMLNPDETRAQQRKAVIQALLQEEQEWELKRRGEVATAAAALDQSQSVQHTNLSQRSTLSDEAWTTAREAQLRQLEQMKVQQHHQQQQQQQQQQMMLMQQQQQLLKQKHYA